MFARARTPYDTRRNFRIGWEHQDYSSRTTRRGAAANITTAPIDVYTPIETHRTTPTKSKQRRLSSRYGLVYQPASRLDLYGQYATSFKPNFNLQPDGSELKPEMRYGRVRYSVSMNNLTDTEYWASQRGSHLYYPGEGRRILATLRIGN